MGMPLNRVCLLICDRRILKNIYYLDMVHRSSAALPDVYLIVLSFVKGLLSNETGRLFFMLDMPV